MSQVRFISDYHFGHNFLAELRGFPSTRLMNECIIEVHNSVVHKKDLTYILGDISMETYKFYHLLDAMAGRKIIVLGNHDNPKHVKHLLNHCDSVAGMIKYRSKQHGKFFLTHAPMMEKEHAAKRKITANIHGHVHENSLDSPWHINVCCEVHDYIPQTLEQLVKL